MTDSSTTSQNNDCNCDNLFPHVIRGEHQKVTNILRANPQCVNKLFSGETLLDTPCRYGDIQMVRILIETGIQVNNCNKVGNPPLVNAITYNQFPIVKLLCQHKAKVQGFVLENGLTIIDLAVLHGRYEIAEYIFNLLEVKDLKTAEEYDKIAKKYYLRYVNYEMVIQGLKEGKSAKELGDFEIRPLTPIDSDEEEEEDLCCWCCCPMKWFTAERREKKGKKKEIENPEKETERRTNEKN